MPGNMVAVVLYKAFSGQRMLDFDNDHLMFENFIKAIRFIADLVHSFIALRSKH